MSFLTKLLIKISNNKTNVDYSRLLPYFEPQQGITKKINQTYWTKSVPESIAKNIKHLKELNPGWDYQLYDDADIEKFIKKNYGNSIWSYYARIDSQYGAAKADFFRYLLIYKEGGIYIDLKSTITKPLDELILPTDQYILSYWDNQPGDFHQGFGLDFPEFKHIERGEYMQWYIIAAPGHPFLRAVLLQVLQNIGSYNPYKNGVGWQGTVGTTGPVPYTLVIEREQLNYDGLFRWVNLTTDFGFRYSIYETEKKFSGHASIFKNDYRKGRKPVIKHRNKLIQGINVLYLSMLAYYRSKTTG